MGRATVWAASDHQSCGVVWALRAWPSSSYNVQRAPPRRAPPLQIVLTHDGALLSPFSSFHILYSGMQPWPPGWLSGTGGTFSCSFCHHRPDQRCEQTTTTPIRSFFLTSLSRSLVTPRCFPLSFAFAFHTLSHSFTLLSCTLSPPYPHTTHTTTHHPPRFLLFTLSFYIPAHPPLSLSLSLSSSLSHSPLSLS